MEQVTEQEIHFSRDLLHGRVAVMTGGSRGICRATSPARC
jgi:hypothetical protein